MGSTKVVALHLIAMVVIFAACVELGEAYYVYDFQCFKACYPKRCCQTMAVPDAINTAKVFVAAIKDG